MKNRLQNLYDKIKHGVVSLLPGFLVCLVIALIAQFIAKLVPSVGAALFAIGLGILCGNTFLNHERFNRGTKFSESRLLEYSIVLTGLTLNLSALLQVGWQGIVFILAQMTLTIAFTYGIGRKLRFGRKFSLLMCAGNAVCGSSAIGTVSPILGADSKDKGISITIVNVTGTAMMILLPLLAGALYQHETIHTSALIGGTLQSIGQVIASAKFVNEDVVQMATVFKITRIIFLVGVALVFSRMNMNEEKQLFEKEAREEETPSACVDAEETPTSKQKKVSCGIPWFIIGFFLLSVITSTGFVPVGLAGAAKAVSNQFEIIALAAIGMRVKFRDLVKEGPRSILYGGIVGTCQTISAVGLIFLLLR